MNEALVTKYKNEIKKRLTATRYEHCLCVAEEALRLSVKYGADSEKAYYCGLLHDVLKDADIDEQLGILEKYGYVLSDIERVERKLWHAKCARVYLQNELGVTDIDTLNAISYHTTARQGMSILEKVLFIADFTSKDRDYSDVDDIRNAANKSLEDALYSTLSFSLIDLAVRHKPIHPDTLSAYNELMLIKSTPQKSLAEKEGF